jgi:hypothetical protein
MLLRGKDLILFFLLLLVQRRDTDLREILKRVSGTSSVEPGLFYFLSVRLTKLFKLYFVGKLIT